MNFKKLLTLNTCFSGLVISLSLRGRDFGIVHVAPNSREGRVSCSLSSHPTRIDGVSQQE